MRILSYFVLAASLAWASPVLAENLVSPVLTLKPSAHPRVALTLDACTGSMDNRILDALVTNNIKATVFVTARWLKRNPDALARILARKDLFAIENHGAKHLLAAPWPGRLFGVRFAGYDKGLKAEVEGGAKAIVAATGRAPQWYRGAVAKYAPSGLPVIEALGEKIAGYSLAGDGGAQFSAKRAETVISAARPGDVILAHLNQPKKAAGVGVVQGILALKAKGFEFAWLDDAAPEALPKPTPIADAVQPNTSPSPSTLR